MTSSRVDVPEAGFLAGFLARLAGDGGADVAVIKTPNL
jgi:hypothetical protein